MIVAGKNKYKYEYGETTAIGDMKLSEVEKVKIICIQYELIQGKIYLEKTFFSFRFILSILLVISNLKYKIMFTN